MAIPKLKRWQLIAIVACCVGSMWNFLFPKNGDTADSFPNKVLLVMTSDETRDVVFAWPSFPVSVHVEGQPGSELLELVEESTSEISNIAGRQVMYHAGGDLAEIHVVLSINDWSDFFKYYEGLFMRKYGAEEFIYWKGRGAFDFPIADEHPCFGFGITSPEKFSQAGYTRSNTPDFFLIGILGASSRSSSDYMACLREELSHALFFIPDYSVDSWQDSIFNSNATTPELTEFSDFDRDLVRFLANASLRHVNYEQLKNLARKFSHNVPLEK